MSVAVERKGRGPASRLGFRRLFSSASARDISRALVRSEAPPAPDTLQLSMFGHGQDTRIQNSTINTTVNYIYTVRRPLDIHSPDGTPQQNNTETENVIPSAVDASASSTTIELHSDTAQSPATATQKSEPPRDAREVYVDILITKNRGFPLWIPSPNTSLPAEYRHSGVSIGDVGILTAEGGFDFIFNIFAEAGDPVNAHSGLLLLPDSFTPLRPSLRQHEIQRFKENTAGTMLGDDSLKRLDNGEDESRIILTTSASEAAVLMMPEDVFVAKIQNQDRLRAYVSAHIIAWYAFVRHTLGRAITNGDLRVVYGHRKSTAFGIAAVSTAAQNTTEPTVTHTGHGSTATATARLTFCETAAARWAASRSGYKYRWSHVGSAAEVKTGPEYRESAELMYPAYGTSTTLPENQCLFICTVDAKLSAEAWKEMEALAQAVRVPGAAIDTMRSEHAPPSSWQLDSQLLSSENNSASGQHPSAARGPSTTSPAMHVLFGKLSETTVHPSNILNDVLLETNPEARLSIVCNDDWEEYMHCQGPLEFVSAILCQRSTVVENNVVYLQQPLPQIQKERPLIRVSESLVAAHARVLPLPQTPVERDLRHVQQLTETEKFNEPIDDVIRQEGLGDPVKKRKPEPEPEATVLFPVLLPVPLPAPAQPGPSKSKRSLMERTVRDLIVTRNLRSTGLL